MVEGGIRRVLEDDICLREKSERRVCQRFGVVQLEDEHRAGRKGSVHLELRRGVLGGDAQRDARCLRLGGGGREPGRQRPAVLKLCPARSAAPGAQWPPHVLP